MQTPSTPDKIHDPRRRVTSLAGWTVYSIGRFLQLVGMSVLLMALLTAGPLGPSPRVFGAGIVVFVAGWGLVKLVVRRRG